jgi:hypothetical protein
MAIADFLLAALSWLLCQASLLVSLLLMDQIFIKTPNHKCRLYWCLIDFIDWRYSQSCWYFRCLLGTSTPLTFSLVLLPPPPFPVKQGRGVVGRGGHQHLQIGRMLDIDLVSEPPPDVCIQSVGICVARGTGIDS